MQSSRAWNRLTHFFTAENRFSRAYKRIFSIHEIESDLALQWFGGAILFGYFLRFYGWMGSAAISVESIASKTYTCWPFFPNCERFYFLSFADGTYSQSIAYMLLFAVMLGVVWLMASRRWGWVHAVMLLLFAIKVGGIALSYQNKGNYDYHSLIFSVVFLFLPCKRFFGQLAIVTCYSVSTIAKIHPSWTLGTYFSSLAAGLPIFGKGYEWVFTNAVILLEMVLSWFLFSSNRYLQRGVLGLLLLFHLYSGTFIYYLYPAIVVPPTLALFGPWFKAPVQVPLSRKSLAGWAFIALLVASPLIPRLMEGDEKMTMEGNFYSFYMFDANHQCSIQLSRNNTSVFLSGNVQSRFRCDIYPYYFRLQNTYCKNAPAGSAPYRFVVDHSINGGLFYRIVDEPDFCKLEYKSFTHNKWIHDQTTAPPVARALENYYF